MAPHSQQQRYKSTVIQFIQFRFAVRFRWRIGWQFVRWRIERFVQFVLFEVQFEAIGPIRSIRSIDSRHSQLKWNINQITEQPNDQHGNSVSRQSA